MRHVGSRLSVLELCRRERLSEPLFYAWRRTLAASCSYMTKETLALTGKYFHEEIYGGAESMANLAMPQVTICCAGALGSNLAGNLARQGFRKLRIIDRHRVEEHNVSTQIFGAADVGAWKAEVVRNRLF